jgi:high affinity choline transporter 7
LDLDFSWSIVLSAAIVILYTMMGGLWSVAITDVAQLVVLVAGLWVVVPLSRTRLAALRRRSPGIARASARRRCR